MNTTKKIFGIALALTCGLVVTIKAQNIYVSNNNNTIGEYGMDGSTVTGSLIELVAPWGIAVSGNDLFVANAESGTVDEYTTSGETVNGSLISGLNGPYGIAISGNDLFVANQFAGTIGEYTTSGATVNASLISGLSNPVCLAIARNNLFVGNIGNGAVGEYTTSGSTVNASLITGLNYPYGIATSGNDLFVSDLPHTLGEYTTSGTTVNASLITGLSDPFGIAISGNNLFVANYGSGTIGEYTTSGATVNASLISGLNSPLNIAISSVPEPSGFALAGLGAAALWLWRLGSCLMIYASFHMRTIRLGCRVAFADKGLSFCLTAIALLSSLLLVPLQSAAQVGHYLDIGGTNIIILAPGTYNITAYGADGGADTGPYAGAGGLGAEMSGEFVFSEPTTLTLMVGGVGEDGTYGGGGGGGTFVVNGATPLVVAGGGGGGGVNNTGNGSTGSSGNPGSFGSGGGGGSGGSGGGGVPESGGAGGGGYSGNGAGYEFGGGESFLNGGAGGSPGAAGGYGGGGAGGIVGGGGGGGYSGGGGGSYAGGGGGGSYIDSSAIADVTEVSGVASPDDSPNGEIVILQGASFIEQPSLTVAFTSNVTFQAVVQGPPPLAFQWFFNGTALSDNGHFLDSTETNLTIMDFLPGDIGNYTLVVSNYAGSITSAVATINILNPLIASQPQPQSQSALGGDTVNISVSATGQEPLAYQWQFNGTNLPDATTNPLILTSVLVSQSGIYSVIVTNSYGTITSSNATLNVTAISIGGQPQYQSVLAGANATFSVNVNGQQPFFYQWLLNGAILPDATNDPLVLTNVIPAQEGIYSVVVTNAYGMTVSSNASLTVEPLAITTQPTNRITWPYGPAAFTVNVIGQGPFSFDWQCNGIDIPGTWTNVLTLTNVQPSQFGAYDVIVSNAWGSVTSTDAILSLSQVAVWGGNSGETNLIAGLTNVVAIAASYPNSYDCMALRSNGTAIHWPAPNIIAVTNILSIGGGDGPFLVLKRNGEMAEWLEDYDLFLLSSFTNVVAIPPETIYSVIALGTSGIPIFEPGGSSGAPTNTLTNVVSVAQGYAYTLALKSDGTVVGWGNGAPGENVPSGLSNVVAIAAGYFAAYVVKSDGTIAAWGENADGLVTGAAGLTNVIAIAAGQFHALALLANGTVTAWGGNTYGGTNVPPGLTNVIAISAGEYQSMALIGNGPPILNVPMPDPIIGTNGRTFSIPSQSGRVYMLQYLNSLTDTDWVSLPLIPGTGGPILLKDPSPTNPQRFYRVLRW